MRYNGSSIETFSIICTDAGDRTVCLSEIKTCVFTEMLLSIYGDTIYCPRGFNLDFRAPVSLVFKSYESVPVLLTVAVSFIAGFLLATFIFLTGMTGRFFKERKKRKEEKIRLKTALPEKKKLSGLPHYDE